VDIIFAEDEEKARLRQMYNSLKAEVEDGKTRGIGRQA
jgi:hypothetical protein